MTPEQAKAEAVKRCGGATALALRLGINRRAVHKWRVIPAYRVPLVSRLSGIPRHVLRPDLWEPDLWEPETA